MSLVPHLITLQFFYSWQFFVNLGLSVKSFLEPLFKDKASSSFEVVQFLFNWQTLASGLVAFFPAAIAAIFMWRQLKEQKQQFLRLNQNQSNKARLRLSHKLPEISRFLDAAYEKLSGGIYDDEYFRLPDETVNDLLDATVLSSRGNFEYIQQYVMKIQIFCALVRAHRERPSDEMLAKIYSNLAMLDFMTDDLYPYVRFEVEEIKRREPSVPLLVDQLKLHLDRRRNLPATDLERLIKKGKILL